MGQLWNHAQARVPVSRSGVAAVLLARPAIGVPALTLVEIVRERASQLNLREYCLLTVASPA
jgi:hypothetical protein